MPLLTTQSAKGFGWGKFAESAITSDYESIQTITVGSGGLRTASFTSIPATFKHLEIRLWGYSNRTDNIIDDYNIRINGDTGYNYSYHFIIGEGGGTTPSFGNGVSVSTINSSPCIGTVRSGGISNGGAIIQIPDYANTNKLKTLKLIGGCDLNGATSPAPGRAGIVSGVWQGSNNAISQIDLFASQTYNWGQYTNIALYGIKG